MYFLSQFLKVFLCIIILFSDCKAFQIDHLAYNHDKVPSEFNELKNAANEYYNEGQTKKAIKATSELIERCFEKGYEKYIVDLYEYIADFIANEEDTPLQKKIGKIAFFCDSEDRVDLQAVKYSYWAQAYLIHNKVDSAKLFHQLATNYCNQHNFWLVNTNLNIGFSFLFYYSNNFKKTLEYIKKAESIAQEKLIPKKIDVPQNLYIMQGLIYRMLGYKEKAIISDIRTIEYIKNDNSVSSSELSDRYHHLAVQYDELGDFDNAILYYKRGISLAKKYNLEPLYSIYYPSSCLASCYQEKGQTSKALTAYKSLISNINRAGKKNETYYRIAVQSYQNLARLYMNSNQQDSTIICINKLYEIHNEYTVGLWETHIIDCQYNISIQNYNEAEKQAQNALSMIENAPHISKNIALPVIYNDLSIIHLKRGNPQQALSYCQKNLHVQAPKFSEKIPYQNPKFEQLFYDHALILTITTKLKILEALYAQKDAQVTPQLLLSTIKLGIEALEHKNKDFKSKSSQTYWLNQKAIPLFEKAIQIALDVYEQTQDQQYLNEAFMLSERSKSIMMMNALQEQNANSFGGVPKELIKREQELERDFKVIEKAKQDAEMSGDMVEMQYQDSLLFDYHHQKNALLEHFEAKYPKYYELKHVVHQTSIQEVQAALDEQTLLIEYFQGQEKIYVFTISNNQSLVHSFKHTKAYDVQLASFQHLLIDIEQAKQNIHSACRAFIKSSYELYQLLLVNNLLPNKKHLLLIPDGQLAYLPFEVLLTEELADAANDQQGYLEFSQLPYLLHQYTTNYNYSAQLFLQQKTKRVKKKGCEILAVAPSYSNKSAPEWRNPYERQLRKELTELPGAVRELNFLKELFGGEFLYKEEANEANFKEKAPSYEILHLAVHGLLDEEKPELSGLALEEDNSREEDNILYDYEIKQLDLQAQLVVLSACETGIGKYQHGEGVMSIGRGFMYAGVPSLMTTLWSLNDYSGYIIIKEFYQNLQNGLPKDEALRQAKIHYLQQHNGVVTHPSFWACLIQVGDYNALNIEPNNQKWYYGIAGLLVLLLGIGIFIKIRKK